MAIVTCPRCGVEANVLFTRTGAEIDAPNFDFTCAEIPPLVPGQKRDLTGDFSKCQTLTAAIDRVRHPGS